MSLYLDQLQSIADACVISGPHTFAWFGKSTAAVPASLRKLETAEKRPYLKAAIRERIYQDAFSPGVARPTPSQDDQLLFGQDRAFARGLAEASVSQGGWEPEWTIVSDDGHSFGVESRGLTLWVTRRELGASETGDYQVGDKVSLRMPRGSFDLSPGYYSAFSNNPAASLANSSQILRLYLALAPTGARQAMRSVTEQLNRVDLPFRFKMLSSPLSYFRADSAVLYVAVEDLDSLLDPLRTAVAALVDQLRDVVPMFTQPAGRGLALAEEVSSQESFGQHRSALTAEGILRAAEHALGKRQVLESVVEVWTEAGFDVERPYLNPGSPSDRYAELTAILRRVFKSAPLPGVSDTHRRPESDVVQADRRPAPRTETVQADPLVIAEYLGARLVREAVWHGDRCTWLSLVPIVDDGGLPTLAYGAIGNDLYDGVAGVALFLAVLGVITGSGKATATAQAAARQALRLPDNRPGLYIGRIGSIVSAASTAILLGDDDLLDRACREAACSHSVEAGPDLLLGTAGQILGLLTLAHLLDDPSLTATAAELGTELVSSAHRTNRGWSWSMRRNGRNQDLTGLSHGASGVAAALIELAAATGDGEFARAAEQALAYERAWFDSSRKNWPDLREITTGQMPPTVFLTQWCHGAPGVAMVRMRATQVLADPLLAAEATIALHTTLTETRRALAHRSLSFSLCHGIAGNIDILLDGIPFLESHAREDVRKLAHDFVNTMMRRHLIQQEPWPCGIPVPNAEVPGLFLGLAGIGYHLLKVAGHAVPSVLRITPHQFRHDLDALLRTRSRGPSATMTITGGVHA
jgi:hypothetical protein